MFTKYLENLVFFRRSVHIGEVLSARGRGIWKERGTLARLGSKTVSLK